MKERKKGERDVEIKEERAGRKAKHQGVCLCVLTGSLQQQG